MLYEGLQSISAFYMMIIMIMMMMMMMIMIMMTMMPGQITEAGLHFLDAVMVMILLLALFGLVVLH